VDILVKGKGPVTLSKQDFLASGGQGQVYVKGSTAYKIYDDLARMIPEAKINELAVLSLPNIIKPEHALLNKKRQMIGYDMHYVPDTYTLCQLFPKPFRARNSITPDNIVDLVRRMRATISAIHAKKILIVDLNEMNFLVSKKFNEVYFIDVDSYQTHTFPANAIMESIRDRHTSTFSELTDWFSFAIVSFQMFRGIHPYQGRHPDYDTLDERMIHNLSILNPAVTYPVGAVLPETVVPDSYRSWYRAVLEEGKRLAPPTDVVATIHIVTPTVKVLSGTLFDIIELPIKLVGTAIAFYRSGTNYVYMTSDLMVNGKNGRQVPLKGAHIGFTVKNNAAIAATLDGNKLVLTDLNTGTPVPCDLRCDSIFEGGGRLYYKYDSNILELDFVEMGPTIRPLSHLVANVLGQATQVFPGCVIQNVLGSYYVNVFPEHKKTYQIRLRELDSCRVIAAKCEGRVLQVVGAREGKYNRFVFIFDEKFAGYQCVTHTDVTYTGLNFVVLPQGICVSMNEDDSVDVFSISDIRVSKHLTDKATQGMLLMCDGASVVVSRNSKLYQLKMK
jgi:hypothetical protein